MRLYGTVQDKQGCEVPLTHSPLAIINYAGQLRNHASFAHWASTKFVNFWSSCFNLSTEQLFTSTLQWYLQWKDTLGTIWSVSTLQMTCPDRFDRYILVNIIVKGTPGGVLSWEVSIIRLGLHIVGTTVFQNKSSLVISLICPLIKLAWPINSLSLSLESGLFFSGENTQFWAGGHFCRVAKDTSPPG